ncbi:bifunctional nicotinamidase/pyrazinamidase [Dongia deserti]|uniref:bifunctional nicotinamidase/pyrazinamidase n=1 Tax=Dongia deserti TaxID=2268030 RepID=UPI000E659E8E|nr:bifunctional nicotinamidase/pyrazinamidase [Dongia deserti]
MAGKVTPTVEDALIVIDVQNDFCPGGALAVPKGDEIVPLVNRLIDRFDHVILTQDWHPRSHSSFASTHKGKPFTNVKLSYGEQTLWPDHCVQGTKGAEFHRDLAIRPSELVLRKGFRKEIDSYSAFYENDRTTKTGLCGYLRDRGLKRLFMCGLATDFCVAWSALDGRREGFPVVVLEDACRAIDLNGSLTAARGEMIKAGITVTDSSHIG